jgi:threonyl-tRNA synthetase
VYRETPFSDEDLAAIEARMAEVVARDEKFVREEEPREMGLKDYAEQGEFMKVHFIEKFTKPGEEISLYRMAGLWTSAAGRMFLRRGG